MHPSLAAMLWPTIEHDAAGIVINTRGEVAVVVLTPHPPAEVAEACLLQLGLGRGVFVLV